jgi:putative transposase
MGPHCSTACKQASKTQSYIERFAAAVRRREIGVQLPQSLSYRYRLLPARRQHRALEAIVESQRELYNAALEERIDAYRKAGISRTYIDQTKALAQWRREDPEGRALSSNIQRATLKRVDDSFQGFFRRVASGNIPGFPRFRGRARFDGFGFREWHGITFRRDRLRFQGMPGSLRVHVHRPLPDATIKTCRFRRDAKGWTVSFVVAQELGMPPPEEATLS